jgi:AcrR family transcriptional regulator
MKEPDFRKMQMLKTAMRLYALHGIEAVPLRVINRDAGCKNNSAMHYHFGNKAGLLDALAQFIQERFEEVREHELVTLENQITISSRDILRAFMAPYLKIMEAEEWGYDAVRFVARMEFESDPETRSILNKYAAPSIARFKKLLVKALPEIPTKVLYQRYNFCMASIMQGLADHKSLSSSYMGNMAATVKQLEKVYLDVCASGLGAPV